MIGSGQRRCCWRQDLRSGLLLRRMGSGAVMICLAIMLALAGSPGSVRAELRTSRSVRVALAVDQAQVLLSGRGQYRLYNLATGEVVDEAPTGWGWSLAWCAQGIEVSRIPVTSPELGREPNVFAQSERKGVYTGPLRLKVAGGPPADSVSASLQRLSLSLPPGQGVETGSQTLSSFLWFQGCSYRGEIEVLRGANALTVVNVIPLEEYLYGVVGSEMPAEWPAEALKAQAVAARTYALGRLGSGPAFDMAATPTNQAYRGLTTEHPAIIAAVDATRGLVLTYNGQLAQAFYHASSGGHTEDVENVWSTSLPYLRGVEDEEGDSPWQRWTRELTLTEIGQALQQGNLDVGDVVRVEPAGPRGVSGRWTKLRVVGSRAEIELSGNKFYLLTGLRSCKFEMETRAAGIGDYVRPAELQREVVVLGASGRVCRLPLPHAVAASTHARLPVAEAVAGGREGAAVVSAAVSPRPRTVTASAIKDVSKPPEWLFPPSEPGSPAVPADSSPPVAPAPSGGDSSGQSAGQKRPLVYLVGRQFLPERILFTGSGWGHGVGMSQYGARHMALQGHNYQEILKYYYRGTELRAAGTLGAAAAR